MSRLFAAGVLCFLLLTPCRLPAQCGPGGCRRPARAPAVAVAPAYSYTYTYPAPVVQVQPVPSTYAFYAYDPGPSPFVPHRPTLFRRRWAPFGLGWWP